MVSSNRAQQVSSNRAQQVSSNRAQQVLTGQQQQQRRRQQSSRITYRDVADATSNYVDTLFTNHNMEYVLREAIRESKKSDKYGWLPSDRMDEDDIVSGSPSVVQNIVSRYLRQDAEQSQKDIYVGNLAVSKNNGQNHYCAFWVDKPKRKVYVWDSATSGLQWSEFTKLFKRAAELLFSTTQADSTGWVDSVAKVPASSDKHFFQHGGGYYGPARSLLAQNIFCHTWTLFFLELRLNGMSPQSIGCTRGAHPILPLLIIKLYAQCLLRRMGKDPNDIRYRGLQYVWDDENQKALPLPSIVPRTKQMKEAKDFFCAKRVVDTAIASSYYVPPKKCRDFLYL